MDRQDNSVFMLEENELLTVEGEALALIPALVFGQEVLKVVVGVVDGADLVDVVDEVAFGHG